MHGRSALVGQVIFKDIDGRIYRDLDLKGIGKVEFNQSKPSVGLVEMGPHGFEGLFRDTWARVGAERAEEFLKFGIRTERYLALIELEEFIDENGNKVLSIDKLSIGPTIVAVRVFGTKNRISDINDTSLLDAKTIVAQEQGKNEQKFSWRDYLKWFSETLGKNVGLMHKNDYIHRFLLNHNITLDCRIVDLDFVDEHGTSSQIKKDIIRAGHGALHRLFNQVSKKDSSCGNFNEYLSYFYEAYKKAMGEKFDPGILEGIKREHEESKKRRKEKFGEPS